MLLKSFLIPKKKEKKFEEFIYAVIICGMIVGSLVIFFKNI